MGAKPEHHYTNRVGARVTISKTLLRPEHEKRRDDIGILERDLNEIILHGEEAARQDLLQNDALAGQFSDFEAIRDQRADIETFSEKLRNCLPAVAKDMIKNPETRQLGRWLSKVSFDRFRLVLPPENEPVEAVESTAEAAPSSDASEAASAPQGTMVQRRDRLSAARALLGLTVALLAQDREPIVEALAERKIPKDKLEWLRDESSTTVDNLGGALRLKAVEHTQLESDAVGRQKEAWEACRRMIRNAVKGNPDLETLWAKC
jgi:hypothetical protein